MLESCHPGILFIADARAVMARIPSKSISLVCLDPPFGIGVEPSAQIELRELLLKVFLEARRVLRSDGNLTCTIPEAGSLDADSFNARLLLPQLFGREALEISRPLRRIASTGQPRSDRQVTLWLPVSEQSTYHPPHSALKVEELSRLFPCVDARGRYRWADVTTPGFRPLSQYQVLGASPPDGRSWRFSEDRMRAMVDAGLIAISATGRLPRLKQYSDDRPLPDAGLEWSDLPPLPLAEERIHTRANIVGQQPIAFSRRLVEMLTNPNDVVLDPCCGTGTTIIVAQLSKRRWIGSEIVSNLAAVIRNRMLQEASTDVAVKPSLDSWPTIDEQGTAAEFVAHLGGISALQQQVGDLRQLVEKYTATFTEVRNALGVKDSGTLEDDGLRSVLERLAQVIADRLGTPERMEKYSNGIAKWLPEWSRLGDLSREFLPQAEMLLDLCASIGVADYGVAVIQYCKTLEYELLFKLFEAYKVRFDKDVADAKTFLSDDLGDDATERFAKDMLRTHPKFTLGGMAFVMGLVKRPDGKTLSRSKLLQSFRDFVEHRFDERVREDDFVRQIDEITKRFRNEAAHPGLIDRETALACQAAVRACLRELIQSYRPVVHQ